MSRGLLASSLAAFGLAACGGREPAATPVPAVASPAAVEAAPAAPAPPVASPVTAEASTTPESSLDASSAGGSAPVRLREGMTAPRRVSGELNAMARLSNSGRYSWSTCILEAVVSKEGRVTEVRWLKPREAAAEARAAIIEEMLTWRFVPAMDGDEPIAIYYTLTVNHCSCILKAASP